MAAPVNSNPVDLHTLNWQAALEKGTLAGHEVKAMSEAVAGKKASDLSYNSKAKTISYGPHILKLHEVAAAEPSLSVSSVWHWASLSLSGDYEQEHHKNLSHLAKLIEEKLQLDQKIGPGKEVIIPIHEAIQKDDLARVKELIQSGADIDVRNKAGYSPLMRTKNPAIQDALIQAGADVNVRSPKGDTLLEYAIISDPIIAQKLIDRGADVNVIGNLGLPPIILTILSNNLPLLKSLINAKADLNAVFNDSRSKFSPIDVALNEVNSLELTRVLLEAGVDINHMDVNVNSTPLQRAILNGNEKIFNALLALGVDVNKSDKEDRTPLKLALLQSNKTMFTALLNAGANINHITENGRSLLDQLKVIRPKNYHDLVQIFLEKSPLLKNRNKELKYRLNLSHAWHLSGTTSLSGSAIDLEGAFSADFIRQIHKNFESFLASYPDLIENSNTLKSALEHALESKSIDEDINRIQAGLPTFIQTGFKEHAVSVLVWKNQFIICNRGASSRAPIEAYHFDPKLLTPEILKAIKTKTMNEKDFQTLFFNTLPLQLNFLKTPWDLVLERAYPLPPQSIGNCSWVSFTTAVYAYMLISGLRGEKDGQLLIKAPEDIDKTIDQQVAIYRTWLCFEQISSLEKMLKLIGKTGFEPDHALIQRGIRKAYFIDLDPKNLLGIKLETFTTQYTATLAPEEALLFKTNLECWKMEAKMDLPGIVKINL